MLFPTNPRPPVCREKADGWYRRRVALAKLSPLAGIARTAAVPAAPALLVRDLL
jgi:hypothetical protein